MDRNICIPPIKPSYFSPTRTIGIGIGTARLSFSRSHSIWTTLEFELNLPRKGFVEQCISMIAIEDFESAVDIILGETLEYSKIFAKSFGKVLEDKVYVSQIIEELNKMGVVNDENWNRLSTLLMVLDGIDVEVNEYGGELVPEDLEYALEYIGILKRIMVENDIYVGNSYYSFVNSLRNTSRTPILGIDAIPCSEGVVEFTTYGTNGSSIDTTSSEYRLEQIGIFTDFRLSV